MNIYDFFNSPDVAEHCQRIGHKLNAAESAVMINQCDARSLTEKHDAYKTIITEYPDMELPEGNNHGHIKSFHCVLGQIIAYEKELLEKFFLTEPDAVYRATIDTHDGGLFTSYEAALTDALEDINNEEEAAEHLHNEYKWEIPAATEYFSISKTYINSGNGVVALISRAGEVIRLSQNCVVPRKQDDDWDYMLDSFYIDIPVPFKRGDLVEVSGSGHMFGRTLESSYGGVYVLQDICRDGDHHSRRLYRGDLMDMTAEVFYERNGFVECECIHFYPDLQYCCRDLEGEKRILKYVSLYMQDKLCLCSLLKAHTLICREEGVKEISQDHNFNWDMEQIAELNAREG